MRNALSVGVKTRESLIAASTLPFAYWSFATDKSEIINTTGTTFPNKTASGTADFSTTPGRLTLDNSSYYTFDSADNAGLRSLLNLAEGTIMVFATVNINPSETGQSTVLSVHTGAGPNWRLAVTKGTTWRHDVSIAFDSDTSVTQYAGSSNDFAASTDVNLVWLLDNRVGAKQLYRWNNGTALAGASWAGKGACSYDSGPTQRVRMGADSAGTPVSLFWGSIRRLGVVNYGTDGPPARINDIVAELHRRNNVPGRLLLESLA